MSVTLTERERLRAEFNRLNSKAWAEVFRTRVEAVQRANPGMSFETAWDKFERGQENPPPEPTTIGEAAKLVQAQNPTWTFERSWHHAEAVHPELVRSLTVGESRVAARLAPQLNREKWKTESQIEAEARALMANDPRLPFGVALVRAREQHPGQSPAGDMYLVTAQHAVSLDSGTLPTQIQYMPAGRSTINPNVNGKPKQITVRRDVNHRRNAPG